MLIKRLILFTIITIIPLIAIATEANGPKEQLKTSIDQIVVTLKDQSKTSDEKRNTFTKIIGERFDFKVMSQRTLSVNWKKTTPEQRQRFIALFSALLRESYIGRIEAYTDEQVKFTEEKIKKNRAMIKTFIVTSTVEIPINYKLLERDGQWLVYDVIIENVSLIRNYSSTYRNIVKKEGIDGLIVKMEKKLNDIQNQLAKG